MCKKLINPNLVRLYQKGKKGTMTHRDQIRKKKNTKKKTIFPMSLGPLIPNNFLGEIL